MGLLGNGPDDPRSAAIMALAGGLLQGNFGAGLLGSQQAFSQAKEQGVRNQMLQMQMEQHRMQMEKAKRAEEQERGRYDLMPQFFNPGGPAMGGTADVNAALPADLRIGAQAPIPARPPQFDVQGYTAAAMNKRLMDPLEALKLQKEFAPKGLEFGKVDPKDYTPESLRAAAQSGDYTKLVPMRKMDVVNNQAVDLYRAAPGTVFDNIDPNKPFNLRGGQAVPNTDFQRYELGKAQAGAARNSVNVQNVAETEWSKKRAGDFAELMANINKTSFAAPTQVRKLERMEQLLQGVDGGKLAPTGVEIASAANALGIKMDPRLGNKEAAQALSREIAGGFRQPGTGPMTDKDFENFLLQVPDLSKTAEGRKQITATMKAAAARDIEIGNRARSYVKKNGKLDDNFIEEVSLFVAENPVVKLPKTWKVNR